MMRPLQTDSDFWRARAFLREVMLLNGLREHSWHVARWDYWRWHGIANCGMDPFEGNSLLLETPSGEIAAILNCENRNSFYLQVHPRHHTAELEEEMISTAEEEARSRGVNNVFLDTFSFQAPDFYQKLGYRIFGELVDFPPGHARHYLTKRL